ncbi:MAG: hypothetical protein KGJ60_04590 [Verrucomicrobiota bacterium]|nr:hypothetical protein [Verrucomicrobiota bacterium]
MGKRRKYLEENLGAAWVQLTAAEIRELDARLSPGTVAGPRYTGEMMALVNR